MPRTRSGAGRRSAAAASWSKTATRSPAATSREPRPAEKDRTRGTSSPSAAALVQGGLDLAGQRVGGRRAARRSVRRRRPRGPSRGPPASSSAGNGRKRGDRDAADRPALRAEVVDDRDARCRRSCPSRRGSRSRPRCGRRRSARIARPVRRVHSAIASARTAPGIDRCRRAGRCGPSCSCPGSGRRRSSAPRPDRTGRGCAARGSPTNSRSSSSSGRRTFSSVWVVRNPSWATMNGVSVASATRRAMAARSAASWALRAKRIPQPRVGDGHHVVVAGVDVEGLARQRPGADVEDDRQPLAGDDVQDLLHQDEALAGGEVRDPAAGEGDALGGRRRGVLGLGLDEPQRRAPQVRRAVGDRRLVDRGHRRGRGDRIDAGDLGEARFDVGDGLGAVDDRGDARVGRG